MSYIALILLSLQIITVPIPIGIDVLEKEAEDKVQEKRYSECINYDSTIQTHFNYYYELIIEKYRPDLIEEWEKAVSERGAINKKLKEFSHDKQKELHEEISEEWYHEHNLLQEHFLSAVKEREGEEIKKNIPHILTLKKSWNIEMKNIMKQE
jgi:hypothetical protein